jgi:hypothetical protein
MINPHKYPASFTPDFHHATVAYSRIVDETYRDSVIKLENIQLLLTNPLLIRKNYSMYSVHYTLSEMMELQICMMWLLLSLPGGGPLLARLADFLGVVCSILGISKKKKLVKRQTGFSAQCFELFR